MVKTRTSQTGSRGVTLVEMVVVLTIITVLAGLIAPRLSANTGAIALRESANSLLHAARYARHRALTQGSPCRLIIDMKLQQYYLETQATDEAAERSFTALREGPIKATTLSAPTRFEAVLVDSRHRESGSRHTIEFSPTGQADAAVIRLGNDRRTYSLLVMPSTGRAELMDRAVTRLPDDREDLDE